MQYVRTQNGLVKMTDEEAEDYFASQKPNPTYKELRQAEYGSIEKQIEFLVENGFEAFQQRAWQIKNKYPKPKTLTGL